MNGSSFIGGGPFSIGKRDKRANAGQQRVSQARGMQRWARLTSSYISPYTRPDKYPYLYTSCALWRVSRGTQRAPTTTTTSGEYVPPPFLFSFLLFFSILFYSFLFSSILSFLSSPLSLSLLFSILSFFSSFLCCLSVVSRLLLRAFHYIARFYCISLLLLYVNVERRCTRSPTRRTRIVLNRARRDL